MKRIIAPAPGRPIFVENGRTIWRLRQWHLVDGFYWARNSGLTWGQGQRGSHATAYSILRELYGRRIAVWYCHALAVRYIGSLPPDRGFEISEAQLNEMMPWIIAFRKRR